LSPYQQAQKRRKSISRNSKEKRSNKSLNPEAPDGTELDLNAELLLPMACLVTPTDGREYEPAKNLCDQRTGTRNSEASISPLAAS
jgi:hypothetical protein